MDKRAQPCWVEKFMHMLDIAWAWRSMGFASQIIPNQHFWSRAALLQLLAMH